jgi:hypothetical protein
LKYLFYLFLLVPGIPGFSQTKKISPIHSFSQKELAWMDSVNAVLGEVFFDSLMKADGQTGNLHGPDVFWGFRIIDSTSRYATQFYYTRSKKELSDGRKTIYLLKTGPVFVDGWYNQETKIYSTILRTLADTLYNSNLSPEFSIIPGIADTSKRCIIMTGTAPGSILLSGRVSLKSRFEYQYGPQYLNSPKITLFRFTPIENLHNVYEIPKGFDKDHLLVSLDSTQLKLVNDSTNYLFLTDGMGLNDTANNFKTSFFQVISIIDTPPSQIERVFNFKYRASAMYCVFTKEERRKFRKFLRRK